MLDRIEGKGVEVAETDDPSFGLDDLRQAPRALHAQLVLLPSLLYRADTGRA